MDSSTQTDSASLTLTQYRSYVLTLWNEPNTTDVWRCAVQDSQTQARVGFGSFDEMVAFLQAQLLEVADRES